VLGLSLGATALGMVSGVLIGLLAAYTRKWVDEVLMRAMDVLLAFPQIVFVLLLVSTVGPRLWLIVVTVGLTHMPRVARVARGAALEIVNREYIKAAEAIGEPRRRILFAEILPNITSPLLVELGLRLTYSIGLVASVSFLGFGLQPPAADWGLMINENRVGVSLQPWTVALPVTAIALLTVGTNLVTDGVSRALIGLGRRVR
jgi:peptide/nickel transport system permease protein